MNVLSPGPQCWARRARVHEGWDPLDAEVLVHLMQNRMLLMGSAGQPWVDARRTSGEQVPPGTCPQK